MSCIDSTCSPCSFGPINGSCPEVPKMPGAFLETSKAKAGKVGKFSSSFRNGGVETRKFLGSSFWGAEWMVRGGEKHHFIKVQTALFGRCWYITY